MAADGDATHSQILDGVLDLFRRQIRELKGGGSEGDEAVGVGGAPLREALVLHLHDFGGQVTLGGVPPEGVDVERLQVDAALV